MGDDLTLEKIMDLAGPLTPQAMGRIEEALNTPFGELPAGVVVTYPDIGVADRGIPFR